jgi:hypothetical protein
MAMVIDARRIFAISYGPEYSSSGGIPGGSDNEGMGVVPSSLVHQGRIARGVAKATAALARDVVRIRYNLGEDWVGDEAVFFRVLLKDSASNLPHLHELAERVRSRIYSEVQPRRLGLEAYFSFRSESEQATLKEESWN